MRSFCSKDFGQIVVINFKRREFLLEGIIKTGLLINGYGMK